MRDFVLTCSTPCDLNIRYLRQHKIYYVGFYYYIDNKKYIDDFFESISIEDFYKQIKISQVKTSQPEPEQYEKLWKKLISQGYDILHIELSSGLSGAVNSTMIAKDNVLNEYKNAKIYIVDSLTGSCGIGLLIDKVYDYKQHCNDIYEVYKFAEKIKNDVNVVFIVESLEQLIKGGRVSKLAGSIGMLFNIIPLLHVTDDGKLENIKKSRGLNNAMDDLLNIISSNIKIENKILIANSNCYENAKILVDKINNKFSNANICYENITNIGALIGCHTGEKCLVVAYIGNGRI